MIKETKRMLVLAAGVIFVVLGLIGLVLPFLQGILFLVIGVLLLSMYSPAIRARLDAATQRYPRLHYWVKKAESWVVRVIGEV